MTKEEYDLRNPILSFRVSEKVKKEVDEIVSGRAKYESGFNRQRYLYSLLEIDLKKLQRI